MTTQIFPFGLPRSLVDTGRGSWMTDLLHLEPEHWRLKQKGVKVRFTAMFETTKGMNVKTKPEIHNRKGNDKECCEQNWE